MTVRTPVDVERWLSAWLRAQPEVAELVGDRVYTVLPAEPKVWPMARLTRIAGDLIACAEGGVAGDSATVQIDAFGATKASAWTLTRTLQGVIAERVNGVHESVRVLGHTITGTRYLPDPTFTPAQPRALFAVDLHIKEIAP